MNDCAKWHEVVDKMGVVWYEQTGEDDIVVEYTGRWAGQHGDETAIDEDVH